MLFNALVIVVDVVIAARVTMGVPVLRGGRDFRDCWSQLGIAVFFLLFALQCLASAELGWLRQL